jgi:hypothetical protein
MASTIEANLAAPTANMRVPLPGMHTNDEPDAGSFDETQIHSDGAGLFRDRDCLSELSPDLGREDESFGDEASSADSDSLADRVQRLLGKVELHEKRWHEFDRVSREFYKSL